MIADITEFERDSVLRTDLCVIGSGAAGIALAREFLGSRVNVLILEAGGEALEEKSQDPYKGKVAGLRHHGVHIGRARIVGGSTTMWAGQALPFFPIDFEKRDWVPESGWPIDRASLDPYYPRAEDVMQLPRVTYDPRTWPVAKAKPPAYAPGTFTPCYSQFTATPNFSEKYRADLVAASNIKLITHANVVGLDPNEDATHLKSARIRSIEGHALTVEAKYFVVCCGGIESARVLLISDTVEKNGVGNRHDVVGRYFQDHPAMDVPVTPIDKKRFGAMYDSVRKDGVKYSVKIATSEELQRKEKIHHIGGEIYYPATGENPIEAAKDLLRIARQPSQIGRLPKALKLVASQPHKVVGAAYRHYVKGIPPSVGSAKPLLGVGGEQQPNAASRVTLGEERDVLGSRRLVMDWRLTSEDARSIAVFIQTIATEWKRLGLATVDPASVSVMGREKGEHGGFLDANHHMGTTRMGTDPRTSVVDGRCRVHGYDNLYVGSCSVFPTGGFSNPTLTMLALVLRTADELKQLMA